MKLNKLVIILISLILVNLSIGANWRRIVTLDAGELTSGVSPAIAIDNTAIHCGTGMTLKCGFAEYIRSIDHGTTWTITVFGQNPGTSFPSGPPVYIASNSPYVHYFVYAPLWVKNSPDGGVSWSEWSGLPGNAYPSSPLTSARIGNSINICWSDHQIDPQNDEIYFLKSSDGGNSWYSYGPNPGLPQQLTFAEGKSIFPDAAVNNYGMHLVWTDNRNDPDNYEIYYKYSTDGGQTWHPEWDERLTYDADSSFYPAIAVYNNGIHIVFQDKRQGENLIYYKRSLDNGQNWQDEYVIGGGINPDISADRDGLHVVYESNGSIRYRRSPDFGNTWSWHPNGANISYDIYNITDTLRAFLPRICADFRGRHVVWYRNLDNGLERLQYRQYDILPPAPPTQFRIKYITELISAYGDSINIVFDWKENEEPDLAGYHIYRSADGCLWYRINQQIILTNDYCDRIRNTNSYFYYVVAVDQTYNQSWRSNIVIYGNPDIKADIGEPVASIYLVKRDGYIQWDDETAKIVDYDDEKLKYRFDGLNPDATYELGIIFYKGDNNERIQVIKIDGVEQQVVDVPNVPEMYKLLLSPDYYADGEFNLHIEKLFGPDVVVSQIYLWQTDPGSGGQSGGKTGLNQYGYTLSPNIFKNSTTISYELPLQSNVSLKIYNSSGQLMKSLVDEPMSKGKYQLTWDGKDQQGRNVSDGVYLVRLLVDNNITTKRLLVVR